MRAKAIFLIISCSLFLTAAIVQSQQTESIVVVTQDDLPGYWSPTSETTPYYPRNAFNKDKQGCAAIGFVIDSDGTTSSHMVLYSYPDKAFDRAAINAYKRWRFEAANLNAKKAAVFTSKTATFTWLDEEHNKPEMIIEMTALCNEVGKKALQDMVLNAPK